jgi:hypothetical protein
MAILNLNSQIYKMIKIDAKKNDKTIVNQAHYYFLLGKFITDKPNVDIEELKKSIIQLLDKFKTTG